MKIQTRDADEHLIERDMTPEELAAYQELEKELNDAATI